MSNADYSLVYTDTAIILSGVTRNSADLTCAPANKRISGVAESDVAGTLNLQYKTLGGTYTTFQTVAVGAATATVFDYPCPMATFRVQYVNSGTNQARFSLEIYMNRGL